MERKEFIKKLSAGVFFIISIIMIVGVIFTIGMDRGITEPKFQMKILFKKIGGLSVGAPVTLSGVNIGTVARVGFLDEEIGGRNVVVTLQLYKKYKKQLYKSTRFAIITEGVLGEKIIEISMDPMVRRDDLSQVIIGQDPLEIENLAELFGEAATAFLETSKSLNTVTKEMKKISGQTMRVLNRIEQRIIDGNLFRFF